MLPHLNRAGEWFLRSGIQEENGGVARYYSVDLARNHAVSTEITGYAAAALALLHSVTGDSRYSGQAAAAARFLTRTAWDARTCGMPFEIDSPALTYFFDCGIVVRGLLAAWRASGTGEFREVAAALGRSMALDFSAGGDGFHPVLSLPDKRPAERDPARWSRSAGCYQLKSALAWRDLWETTGDAGFRALYDGAVDYSLRTYADFLPGHRDPLKVMDRLHAFLYFLEALLPRMPETRCAAALRDGIARVTRHLREIAPAFERADVYAQLLRVRLWANWAGVEPLDRRAAEFEAARLAEFQVSAADARTDGGFYFGRRGADWLPQVSPVATAFALQALLLWEECRAGGAQARRHPLI